MEQGIVTGVIVAAATGGALVGFGLQSGTPVALFNATAAMLAGASAQGVIGFHLFVTTLGMALHWGVATLWGVFYAALVPRTGNRVAMAGAVAVADFLVASAVARVAGVGLGLVLPLGQRIVFAAVLAASLLVGMGLARSSIAHE